MVPLQLGNRQLLQRREVPDERLADVEFPQRHAGQGGQVGDLGLIAGEHLERHAGREALQQKFALLRNKILPSTTQV